MPETAKNELQTCVDNVIEQPKGQQTAENKKLSKDEKHGLRG